MAFDQSTRSLNITTPLGENAIQLLAFSGEEQLSRLFSFELSLLSDNPAIRGADLIGKNVTFSLLYNDGSRRYFNGYVQRFSGGDEDEQGIRGYSATVVPWLWFLTQKSDCRIFQNMTVVEVVSQIFDDLGFTDYETNITGVHDRREYWVQYRETSFNFVSRVLEDEGIFYYFRHEDGKHKLVLSDNQSAFVNCQQAVIDYPRDEASSRSITAHLRSWEHTTNFKSGAWAHTDYNFETPSTSLMANESTIMPFDKVKDYELYDYPGEYSTKPFGKEQSRRRMEELESNHDLASGTSDCKSLLPGGKFKIGRHRVKSEEGGEYVIHRVLHEAVEGSYETGGQGVNREYFNRFECFPSSQSFRPTRATPKPLISGIQTAVVTGPAGEEIYTDSYGRVKVQFHWDRVGQKDENSSLWVRCKQNMAGNKWGFMAIPRIGQEVVVEFLEGDPDHPLITGCVYNAEQMPHYALPAEKTKTYIKTNSSLGGDGHNELMFEDKKDDERVYIHAQKNMDVRVLNDSKERIFGNRHQIIGYEKDGQKGGDQRELVYQDKHQNVKRHQVEHIEGNMQLMIGNGEASDGGRLDVVIENDRLESVGGDSHLTIKGALNQKVDGNCSQSIGGDSQMKVTGSIAAEASSGEIHLKAGMKVIIEAGVQLSLVGPGGFVDIGPAGVTIQGAMVKINSGGAAGSGSGVSAQAPNDPQAAAPAAPALAHNSTSGAKSSR